MKFIGLLAAAVLATANCLWAQELYVNTEPASNMATHSLGIRAENQGFFNPVFKNRSTLELMYGFSKHLMVHGSLYKSNFYQADQRVEGGSVYAKYRFLSVDSVQSHFRGAVFGKFSRINNGVYNQEINLEGDNSGYQAGLVFTKLAHKLAISGSASYLRALNNGAYHLIPGNARDAVGYTLSAGYLLFPKTYESYDQVNVNLYVELLGKTNPGYQQSYLDVAPAIQFIFDSVLRVDLSYRAPLYNNMIRNSNNMYLVRVEYNIFNLFN
ncbi:hypothetical protein GCM10027049_29800 [Mucilaginibacter puniceus]